MSGNVSGPQIHLDLYLCSATAGKDSSTWRIFVFLRGDKPGFCGGFTEVMTLAGKGQTDRDSSALIYKKKQVAQFA
jgi:hypothetical protein